MINGGRHHNSVESYDIGSHQTLLGSAFHLGFSIFFIIHLLMFETAWQMTISFYFYNQNRHINLSNSHASCFCTEDYIWPSYNHLELYRFPAFSQFLTLTSIQEALMPSLFAPFLSICSFFINCCQLEGIYLHLYHPPMSTVPNACANSFLRHDWMGVQLFLIFFIWFAYKFLPEAKFTLLQYLQ